MMRYDCVLFDLDGTLSDSAEGIKKCIEMTMQELQKPCPDLSDCADFIGPPLNRTFSLLCGLDDADVDRALAIYRRWYEVYGTKANRLFDGMTEVLEALKESPMKVAVCTSKNERLARDVIDYLHIGGYLDAICGSLDGGKRKQKEELIPYALEVLGCARDRAVMVGDTCFDTRGAVACGVDFLGVLYGYGRLDTMQAAGAVRFVDTPKEILNYLL